MQITPRIMFLVILIVLLAGLLPIWPYSAGFGYYPSGAIGVALLVLLIVSVMGKS